MIKEGSAASSVLHYSAAAVQAPQKIQVGAHGPSNDGSFWRVSAQARTPLAEPQSQVFSDKGRGCDLTVFIFSGNLYSRAAVTVESQGNS